VTAAGPSCGSCGTELPPNSKFCNECGAPVRPAATAAEDKQVTALFADVVHSMDIAAIVGAERLREIMAELIPAAARGGGVAVVFSTNGFRDHLGCDRQRTVCPQGGHRRCAGIGGGQTDRQPGLRPGRFIVNLSRLDADQADRALIKNVVGHSKFGEQHYEWLTYEALQTPGPLVASFKDRVAAGKSVKSVARSFVGD
jgi:hypothetical protein